MRGIGMLSPTLSMKQQAEPYERARERRKSERKSYTIEDLMQLYLSHDDFPPRYTGSYLEGVWMCIHAYEYPKNMLECCMSTPNA